MDDFANQLSTLAAVVENNQVIFVVVLAVVLSVIFILVKFTRANREILTAFQDYGIASKNRK